MRIEALSLFSNFSLPILSPQSALKEPNGKPVTEIADFEETGCGVPSFTPYVAKVPWHSGSRGLLSRLFPRYGNYCGPNWSSGRDSGSLVWDKEPVDALDHCCYQHDMGYDSYEQADLLRADLVFLDCLDSLAKHGRKPGHSLLSEPYRNLYAFGLRNVLIPYRKFLLQKVDEETRKRLTEEEIIGKDRRKHMS